jgi:hypothetical protein
MGLCGSFPLTYEDKKKVYYVFCVKGLSQPNISFSHLFNGLRLFNVLRLRFLFSDFYQCEVLHAGLAAWDDNILVNKRNDASV